MAELGTALVFVAIVALVVVAGIVVGMIVAGRIDRIMSPGPAPRDEDAGSSPQEQQP